MIVPNTWHNNYHYRKLRSKFLLNHNLLRLLDLRFKVFEDAEMGYTSIFTLRNDKGAPDSIVHTAELSSQSGFEYFETTSVNQDVFLAMPDSKLLLNQHLHGIWLKFASSHGHVPLSSTAYFKFYNGIKTGNNKKYLSFEATNALHRPAISGSVFYRYRSAIPGQYVIFDKEKLWSNTDESNFEVPAKVLIRRTSDHLATVVDNNQIYALDTVHTLRPVTGEFDANYLCAILNSRLVDAMYKLIVPELGKAFAEVKIANLKKLTVPRSDDANQKALAALSTEITITQANFTLKSDAFLRLLARRFSVETPGRALSDWPSLDYGSFVKEVNKVRKKGKLAALTAREDMDFEAVFLEERAKVLAVRGEIERLDREIDVAVYKLYGLTWGEVRIIDPEFWVGEGEWNA